MSTLSGWCLEEKAYRSGHMVDKADKSHNTCKFKDCGCLGHSNDGEDEDV